ncbi:hypothetical protein TYRP_003114 [Tyrophagus putrescentiae]|nr:hypothetical protein TYRP_003114 [Tyrophagus putrescentiae]
MISGATYSGLQKNTLENSEVRSLVHGSNAYVPQEVQGDQLHSAEATDAQCRLLPQVLQLQVGESGCTRVTLIDGHPDGAADDNEERVTLFTLANNVVAVVSGPYHDGAEARSLNGPQLGGSIEKKFENLSII